MRKRARCRVWTEGRWQEAWLRFGADALLLRLDGAPVRSLPLADIQTVTEIAPFDSEPRRVEFGMSSGSVVVVELGSRWVDRLCELLRSTLATAGPDAVTGAATTPRVRPVLLAAASVVILATLALVGAVDRPVGEAQLTRPSTDAASSGPTAPIDASPADRGAAGDPKPAVAGGTGPVTGRPGAADAADAAGPAAVQQPPAAQPRRTVTAPLTGRQVDAASVARTAIVSKIDASAQAMPQVGLNEADIVVEVKIEWGLSRYLAVFHSRQPTVIGPHRSARTTDPDLLSLFGHPLFAFSGANEGVVERLAQTTWKTGVGPGEVPQAWFRDERRPWPHNLFAWSEVLRSRPAPLLLPTPLFTYRPTGAAPQGVPVGSVELSVGATPSFRWDPAIGGWRRWIHGQEHLDATGAPVAPVNLVVLETQYGVSAADAASPEARSVGFGRAWVLTQGRVVGGVWVRPDRFSPYDLRDVSGRAMTLSPGPSWLVLADREPVFRPAG